MAHLEVSLVRASDDQPVRHTEFQDGLVEVSRSLRSAGVAYSQRAITFDAVDGGGYPLPEFLITLTQGAVPALAAILGAWLQARYGRKVRIKMGDLEAEGKSLEEVEALLRMASKFQTRHIDKGENTE